MILILDCGGSKMEAGLFSLSGELIKSYKNELKQDIFHDQNFVTVLSEFVGKQKIDYLIIGLAGISRAGREHITDVNILIQSNIAVKKIEWLTDVELLGCLLKENDIGISIGTGSVLIKKEKNISKIIGGFGYLFQDYLSGWWWFQQLFEISMKHFEGRPEHAGFEEDFLNFMNVDLTRKSLISFAYSESRQHLSELASTFLKQIQSTSWFEFKLDYAVKEFFGNQDFSETKTVFFQGGIINHHEIIQSYVKNYLKKENMSVEFVKVTSLLQGGFEYWKEKQSK